MKCAIQATAVDEANDIKAKVEKIENQLASQNLEPISLPLNDKPSWFQQRWKHLSKVAL
tara:strand:+ start:214 stop:390 length:177 start_codon:yes stop_codon:yes gene_type:complete